MQTRLFLRVLPVLVMVFDAPLVLWVFLGRAGLLAMAALGILSTVPAVLVVLVMKGKLNLSMFRR
ncbi:MAG: hypothetical protein ACRD4Y_17705 [Candidatus Acidiferrales bacterium]